MICHPRFGTVGIIAYFLTEMGYPIAPLVIGVILGPMADQNLRRALIVSGGSFIPIFTRPVALILFLVILLTVLSQIPVYKRFMRVVKEKVLAPLISKIFGRRNKVDSSTQKD